MEPNAQQPQPQNTNQTTGPESPMPGTSITPQTPEAPEAPAADPAPATPPAVSKGPSGKKPLLVVLLIVLLLIAAGAVYWFVLKGDGGAANNASSNGQPEETSAVGGFDPATKFAQYAEDIKTTYADMSDFKPYNDGTETGNSGTILYSERIAHYVWLDSPDNWSGMIGRDPSLSSDHEMDFNIAPYNDLVSKLKTDGFSDYAFDKQPEYEDAVAYLKNDDIVCALTRFSNDRIFYACVRLSELDDQADLVKPFYDSYVRQFPDADSEGCLMIQISRSDIEEAKGISDYEVARGGVGCAGAPGGGAVNFYREKGGEWRYSHGGQDAPMCSEFEDADQQKVFADTSCYSDNTTVITVREHYGL